MKRKKILTNLSALLTLILINIGTGIALAADNPSDNGYKLLEPLNGVTTVSSEGSGFSAYLQTIINIAIQFVGVVSVIMLIWGGLEYVLSSVSEAAKKDAKDRITNSILGLIIALSGYLILNTINPNLTSLTLPPVQNPSKGATTASNGIDDAIKGANDFINPPPPDPGSLPPPAPITTGGSGGRSAI